MTKRTLIWRAVPIAALAGIVWGGSWLVRAEGIPAEPTMYYAGTLEESGVPVNGTRDIRLTLWNDEFSVDTTNRLCRVIPETDTMVDNGRFRIPLRDDGACTEGIRGDTEVWVEVNVEGTSLGRSRIGAVPYAVESESALNGSPPGSVMAFAGATPPPGWLACDGTAVSSAIYPELFAAIRTAWGNGTDDADPATDFNLPDLRGRFLRGLDDGAGRDEQAGSREAAALGGNTGDRVGTVQDEDMLAHRHDFLVSRESGGGTPVATGSAFTRGAAGVHFRQNTNQVGGAETRPDNAAVIYIIKL